MTASKAAVKTDVSAPFTIGPWQDPIVISGAQLDTTSLAIFSLGNNVFLFGKEENGIDIYWAQSPGSTFSGIELLEFGGTPPLTQGPVTAAAFQGQLTLVWSGEPGDPTMWMNTYSGSPGNWIGNQVRLNIPPGYFVCSGTGPALSFLNGEAYLLWAGGALDGYFFTTSTLPSSNNWFNQAQVGKTTRQSTFATPRLVLSSGALLSLWAAPSGNQVVYGAITAESASAVGTISPPAVPGSPSSAPVYAAASVQVLDTGAAAVLLWNTGQYQIHALGSWLPVQAASSNFQMPSDIPGFSAYCLGNTLYVAWASGSNVTIQTATVI